MSVYKVPQDVEADDKLLGPFNFRQFIYLMVSAGLIMLGVFLFQIFPGLIIIPAPFLIFFLALALPLRKDQPMEMYLAAIVSFHTKPRKRFWKSDGIEHLIEISAPVNTGEDRTKQIRGEEAIRRFSYLADIVDTQGWAIKHAVAQDSNVHQDIIAEGNTAGDIFEDRAGRIDSMLQNSNNFRKQQIMQNMNTARNLADYTSSNTDQIQAQTFAQKSAIDLYADSLERAQNAKQSQYLNWNPETQSQPSNIQNSQNFSGGQVSNSQNWSAQPQNSTQNYNSQPFENPPQTQNTFENPQIQYNPYPSSMRQTVISPNGKRNISNSPTPNFEPSVQQIQPIQTFENTLPPIQEPQVPQSPAQINPEEISPEIKRLVSEGEGLSIETIARQAKKIEQKNEIDLKNNEEVVISLR